ncbi:MAG: hypothetical protein H6935_04885 [Thiobacillus sp.]|nr:hypothetical protein [Thiobacillus sp.]
MNKLCFCLMLALAWPAAAGATYKGMDGMTLMRTCQSADKARALAAMCRNYLNGYLDATYQFKAQPGFCLEGGDRDHLPMSLALWLARHADKQKLPAAQALELALRELYPCKGGK